MPSQPQPDWFDHWKSQAVFPSAKHGAAEHETEGVIAWQFADEDAGIASRPNNNNPKNPSLCMMFPFVENRNLGRPQALWWKATGEHRK